jgi:hypothetical protein
VIGIGVFRKHGRACRSWSNLKRLMRHKISCFLNQYSVDISKYLDKDEKCSRFEKPTTNEQIMQNFKHN